jgi:hypothetical protein
VAPRLLEREDDHRPDRPSRRARDDRRRDEIDADERPVTADVTLSAQGEHGVIQRREHMHEGACAEENAIWPRKTRRKTQHLKDATRAP